MSLENIKHAAAIEHFFKTKDIEAVKTYMNSLDYLDQIEFGKEMVMVTKQFSNDNNLGMQEEEFNEFSNVLDDFEGKYLNDQLVSLELEIGLNMDEYVTLIYPHINNYRSYLKEGFINGNKKAFKLNNLSRAIIEYEKQNSFYEPNNWIGIEEYLLK